MRESIKKSGHIDRAYITNPSWLQPQSLRPDIFVLSYLVLETHIASFVVRTRPPESMNCPYASLTFP